MIQNRCWKEAVTLERGSRKAKKLPEQQRLPPWAIMTPNPVIREHTKLNHRQRWQSVSLDASGACGRHASSTLMPSMAQA